MKNAISRIPLVFVAIICLCGCGSSGEDDYLDAMLVGTVSSNVDGTPIASAHISLNYLWSSKVLKETTSDNDGRYSLDFTVTSSPTDRCDTHFVLMVRAEGYKNLEMNKLYETGDHGNFVRTGRTYVQCHGGQQTIDAVMTPLQP